MTVSEMSYGEAIGKLEAYKMLHGPKLNAPWRKNPNLNLLDYINHWIELFGKQPESDTITPIVKRTMDKLTRDRPAVARVGAVSLSDEDLCELKRGNVITRELVPGVVVRIRFPC